MEQLVQRWVLGATGAGFVLTLTTLGLRTAILAVVGALVATNYQRLIGLVRGRRRRRPARSRRRPTLQARSSGAEGDPLPMVPDDPSLIINASGF